MKKTCHFILFISIWSLTVCSEPDPPSNLSLDVQTGKIVELLWEPPFTGGYSGFKLVILSAEDDLSPRTFDLSRDSLSFTLRDLTPGASYEIQLSTIYQDKESSTFISSNFTTKPNTPGHLMIWFRNETTLLVLWQPPYPSGIFDQYRVSISPEDAIQSVLFVEKEGEPPGPAQAAFYGLIPGRAYNISAQTVSHSQVSEPAEAQYRTVPLPPTNVTYNKSSLKSYSFDAVWSPPKTMSEFDRYEVGIRNSVRQTISRSEKRIAHFNENLEPGRMYEVIVKTVSGNVASWPAAVNITTSIIQQETEYTTALLGEDVILPCTFSFPEGTPVPYVVQWQKQDVKIPIYIWYDRYPPDAGEGYEGRASLSGLASLNLTGARETDQGWYECKVYFLNHPPDSPENGSWVHLDVLGPAVITVPPQNTSKLEGDKIEFICEAKALPANITHQWYHNGVDISQLTWLESRSLIRKDGLLFISPLTAEDSGVFTCEVSNGIGSPDFASAYLNVEYPARVTYSPTIQYLSSGLSGILRCYVQANPACQFITWTKDRRPFDPNANPGVKTLNNGSLLFERVSHEHQGQYRCTPYNLHGTAGTSNSMEVLVRGDEQASLQDITTVSQN